MTDPLEAALWWLWYAFRDEIAENVPGYEKLDALGALGFAFKVLEWTQKHGRAITRDEFLAMRDELLAELRAGD